MNNTPTYGWYYFSLDNRAPAWTGVTEFYNFITTNKGKGPYGIETTIDKLELGDYVQFASMHEKFHHTVIVVNKNGRPDLRNINIAAHSDDAYNRPLSTYGIRKIRFIKILGVRE